MTYLKKMSVMVMVIAMATVVFAEEATKCSAKAGCSKDAKCSATKTAAVAEKEAAVCCEDKTKCGTDKCPKKIKEAAAAKNVENPDIAATASDITITVAEVDALVAPRLANMPEDVKANQSKLIKKRALDSLIFQKLLEKKFVENNIEVDDAKLDAEIDKILAENNITVEDFKKRVTDMGRDFNEFRDQVRSGMKYQAMMDKMGDDKMTVTDEEVKKQYQDNPQRFQQEAEVKASHILVKIAPEASDEDKAAAKAKLAEVLVKVKAGEDFAALATENSDCPSGKNGGDLGFFARGRMVKPFSDAAFVMEVDQVSEIVETQFGYHIIKVTEKKEAKTVTFEEAKEEIKTQLEDGKRREFAGKFREDLLKDADIVYYNDFKVEEAPAPAAKPKAVEIKPEG